LKALNIVSDAHVICVMMSFVYTEMKFTFKVKSDILLSSYE